jgi:histidinol-phosphate aminotransferase
MSDILELARPEIRALKRYAHAAWEPALTRLHANENPWADEADAGALGLNRYSESQPKALIGGLAAHYCVQPEQVLASRGSNEGIDLVVRAFCRAGRDRVMVCQPTFAMYSHAAAVQGADVVEVPLDGSFGLDSDALLGAWSPGVKIVFLCSPNNPTGSALDRNAIVRVLAGLSGRAIVVLDEAYIEFAGADSCVTLQSRHPELVVLRTLSKAHGLAGARCGVVLAVPAVIGLLTRIIPPYALPAPTIAAVLAALAPERLARTRDRVRSLLVERERTRAALATLPIVRRIWPSDANFLLVEFDDAARAYAAASRSGLLLRDFSSQPRLAGCLRITVGSPEENDRLTTSLGAA